MEFYRLWGFTNDEIMLMFRLDPLFMRSLEKKITSVMVFFGLIRWVGSCSHCQISNSLFVLSGEENHSMVFISEKYSSEGVCEEGSPSAFCGLQHFSYDILNCPYLDLNPRPLLKIECSLVVLGGNMNKTFLSFYMYIKEKLVFWDLVLYLSKKWKEIKF